MSAKELRRPFRLFFATCFLTLIALAGAPSRNPDSVDALWVAESARALKIARVDGTVLFEIPDAGALTSLVIDASRATLWAYGQNTLYTYDFAGQPRLAAPLPSAGNEDDHDEEEKDDNESTDVRLAVDPNDGSVWLARHKHLYHLDVQGRVLTTVVLAKTIQGLSFDPSRGQVWVATKKHLSAYDAMGQRVQHLIPNGSPRLNDIAYDSSLDVVWVAEHRHRIRRYRAQDGGLQLEVKVAKHPDSLAPDLHGGLWVGADEVLIKLDAEGREVLRRKPFSGEEEEIISLAADPVDGGIWVAAKRAIRYVEANGQARPRLALGDAKQKLKIRALALYTDLLPPTLSFSAPAGGSYLPTNQPVFELRYEDSGIGVDTATLAITESGQPLSVSCTYGDDRASCTPTAPLVDGVYTLQAEVADFNGNRSDLASVVVTVDTAPPAITLDLPSEGVVTNQANFTLAGQLSESASLSLNGAPLPVDSALHFSQTVILTEGLNTYTLTATDAAGNTGTATARVTLDAVPPLAPDPSQIQVTAPEAGTVTVTGAAGSVEPKAIAIITNTRTGESITVTANSDGSFSAQIAAQAGDVLEIRLLDAAGNQSEIRSFSVGGSSGGLPPDPATVAPPLSETGITPMLGATAFLFSGPNPVQTGVAEGTIEPTRAAVIRGQLLDKNDEPLAGVAIRIKDHPQFGQTLSRSDGVFDMAVNGGGLLTIDYQKSGYLPVQRQVQTPWQDYVAAPVVVMIQLDHKVTSIDLTASTPMQVAQGSVTTDADGSRQATVLFPEGTQATMTLPDGTAQALTTLHVRATEYTVGENGPKAMPGPLPPNSGYTYAVELSIDEAIAAGAKRVDFAQPLPVYVDNFLNFPVGGIVPAGWYDREKAAWIPSDNGKIIEILGVDVQGRAELDTDGNGQAADSTKLAQLGITETERLQLAVLYVPGKSLWRVSIKHFTPWDCNWPYGPPLDGILAYVAESNHHTEFKRAIGLNEVFRSLRARQTAHRHR
ncbi:MAG: Ig-like domain-containing protein [Gammaproteobacteria bacterium]